jgi:predicted transcriptional regulator
MTAPTAHAPTRSLLTSLARAGWGDLGTREHHGTRAVLGALRDLLPFKSGAGMVTVAQIAQAAGYSTRWVATRLEVLEDLGVIVWSRGGVVAGTPRPSFIKVVKTALVELIHAARPMKDAADAARRIATRARIAHLRFVKARSRRSDHVEVSADHLTLRGGAGAPLPRVNASHDERSDDDVAQTYARGAAAARAALAAARRAA